MGQHLVSKNIASFYIYCLQHSAFPNNKSNIPELYILFFFFPVQNENVPVR